MEFVNIGIKVILAIIFLYIAYDDHNTRKIRNKTIMALIPFGIYSMFYSKHMLISVVTAVTLCIVVFLIHLLGYKKNAVGGGDLKLFTITPLIFHPGTDLFGDSAIFIFFVLYALMAIPTSLYYRKTNTENKKEFPAGVPYAIAGIVSLFI